MKFPKQKVEAYQIRAFKWLKAILKQEGAEDTPHGRHLFGLAKRPADAAERRAAKKASQDPEDKEWMDLRDKLDNLVSVYVRTRDTKEVAPGVRRGICVTCKKEKDFKELQCGHWIRRKHYGTRWHEINLHPQCAWCNRPEGGNGMEPQHEAYIAATHGSHWPEKLMVIKKMFAKKPSKRQLQEMIVDFTNKLARLI